MEGREVYTEVPEVRAEVQVHSEVREAHMEVREVHTLEPAPRARYRCRPGLAEAD